MDYVALVGQQSGPSREPEINFSYRMGQIVGVLVLVIVILWGAKKLGIVRNKRS